MEIPKPPDDPDLMNIIDKLANFVARNGPEFENMTKQKQKDNPKFSFLFGGEYYNYYKYMVNRENIVSPAPSPAPRQRTTSRWQPAPAGIPQPPPVGIMSTIPPPVCPPAPPAAPVVGVPPPTVVAPDQIRQQLEQQRTHALEEISRSEQNLAAQYRVLIQQQQVKIDELIHKAMDDKLFSLSEQCRMTIGELDSLAQPIIDSCTKDAISNGKNWIFSHILTDLHAKCLAEYLLKRITAKDATFELKLHLIYLINDVLHHCVRKNAEHLKSAIECVVIPIFCGTHMNAEKAQQDKLSKLLNLWEQNHYFSASVVEKMKNSATAMSTYQASLITDHAQIVTETTADINQRYATLQKQHDAFVAHLNTQLVQLDQKIQQLVHAPGIPQGTSASDNLPTIGSLPVSQVPLPPQEATPARSALPPPPTTTVVHPGGGPPIGGPPGGGPPGGGGGGGGGGPPPAGGPPPGPMSTGPADHPPPSMQGPPSRFGPTGFNQPPPNFNQPPPHVFMPNMPQGPPPPPRQFDYAHGQVNPVVQDYNHGQGMQTIPPPDFTKPPPDFSLPPPGFLGMPPGSAGPPRPPHPMPPAPLPPPPHPVISAEDLTPTAPYFELPAGLIAPLVKFEDCVYRPINPRDIRLPPPMPPSERLLAAVEAFYSPPSHEHPRDAEGWEKLGLYEFFRAKQNAKRAKEANDRRSRSRSRSRSKSRSKSRSASPPPRRRRYNSDQSRRRRRQSPPAPSRSDSRQKSRSRSASPDNASPLPYQRNSRSRSRSKERSRSKSRSKSRSESRSPRRRREPSRERSLTPPSFLPTPVAQSVDSRLGTDNKGHQLLMKMGWSGKGLGSSEQGRVDPVEQAEVRDKTDMYKGVGISLNDPFEQFRKSKAKGFVKRMSQL